MKIDTHQHFWNYDPIKFPWISDEMKELSTDFSPNELLPILKQNQIDYCISVQADQSLSENDFLLNYAMQNPKIIGIVGWVDFCDKEIEKKLIKYANISKFKGFRHILQDEPQLDYMLKTEFCAGIRLLEKFNFTYDILIYPNQLKYTLDFIEKFPKQKFIIDHLAKPDLSTNDLENWCYYIQKIALHPNVYCKISGLFTQTTWKHWNDKDFDFCISVIEKNFGTKRIVFGSDWPVINLSATYADAVRLYEKFVSKFDSETQKDLWANNAIRFYNLKI